MRPSLLFWGVLGLHLCVSFPSSVLGLVLVLVSSIVLSRLLRIFVLDKWQYSVPTTGNWWVVITGTSSGIGQMGALHLAARGLNVVATVRSSSDGQALLQRAPTDAIRKRIHFVVMDVASVASVKDARDQVVALLAQANGHLVAVINNAGYAVTGLIEAIPLGRWREQYNVNVFGAVAVTQAFLPLLKSAAASGLSPRVVFVSSVVGTFAMSQIGPYSSSKFALQSIADNARVELARYGIKVVVIQPGAFRTEFMKRLAKEGTYLQQAEEMEEGDELLDPVVKRAAQEEASIHTEAVVSISASLPTPEPVAHAMERSVLTRMPETKMYVGLDTELYKLMCLAPDPIGDLMARFMLWLTVSPFVRSLVLPANKHEE